MMPSENHGQVDRRAQVRRREFDATIAIMRRVIPKDQIGRLRILEFGCGSCESARYLCQLGHLVATDVQKNSPLYLPPTAEFRIADIHHTEFSNGQFDVLFSSQVLEHLVDLGQAFREMKRIGTRDAYYVFSIPTAIWLVLSIPAQMFNKIENMLGMIRRAWTQSKETTPHDPNGHSVRPVGRRWLSRFYLGGHGCYPGFFECFKAFRVKNWKRVLALNGLEVIAEAPLLTYADSDVPFFPPNRLLAQLGFASSYLFVCRKMRAE
jgi:SAM-dependent methyltransferase